MPPTDPATDAIDRSLEEVTVQDRGGYPYIIHELMDGVPRVDPAMLRDFAAWARRQDILEDATVLLAPEAMGIPLAVALSMDTGIPYVVARKREYGMDGELVAYCETGYGAGCLYINDIKDTDRVVIIEDVISTGGTLTALIGSVKSLGADVAGVLCPFSKGDGADKVSAVTGISIHAMKRIEVTDDGSITVQ